MKNPWPGLPTGAPYVLAEDRSIIERFNARYADNPKFTIQTQLLPEPFIGDPDARVYLLNLNPGYDPEEDDAWHANVDYRCAIVDNLSHRPAAFPFYFLDAALKKAPGSKWWRQRLRSLIHDIGIATLSRSLFCVELFPYHSQRYKAVPKALSSNGLAPSSAYAVDLVRRAIQANRTIVVMRSFRQWRAMIPELKTYSNLFRLRNPQTPWLSPNNLGEYDQFLLALRAAT